MPKISDDIIRTVLEQAKIEDVVGDFVTLRKAGVNMTGICPFHDDKHDGNFIVRPSTISESNHGNTYRCFVCDAKGGPVQFLMNAEHMTFPDAIRYLGKHTAQLDTTATKTDTATTATADDGAKVGEAADGRLQLQPIHAVVRETAMERHAEETDEAHALAVLRRLLA